MKLNLKIWNILGIIITIIIAFFLVRSTLKNFDLRQENKRLNEVIATNPHRTAEAIIDTFYMPKDTVRVPFLVFRDNQHASIAEGSVPITYIDSVATALNIGAKAVKEVTRINAELKGKMGKDKVVIVQKNDSIKELNKEIIKWKTRYLTAEVNKKDSTLNYQYNADITVTDFERGGSWFKKSEHFTALSSSDPNLKINGVQNYEQKMNVNCPKLEFGLQGGIGLVSPVFDNENNINPGYYLGTGIQFNF